MSFAPTINPTWVKYGPKSLDGKSSIGLHLSLTFYDQSVAPEIVLSHIFGGEDPETERAADLEASWADDVVPSVEGQSSFLAQIVANSYNYQYGQLTGVQQSMLYSPEGDYIRQQLTQSMLSMIMSELTVDFLGDDLGSEVPDLEILGFTNRDDLSRIAAMGIYEGAYYGTAAHQRVDPQMTELVRELHRQSEAAEYD